MSRPVGSKNKPKVVEDRFDVSVNQSFNWQEAYDKGVLAGIAKAKEQFYQQGVDDGYAQAQQSFMQEDPDMPEEL